MTLYFFTILLYNNCNEQIWLCCRTSFHGGFIMAGVVLKNIGKVYQGGVRAVTDFNLKIKDKEFIILVGPVAESLRR